MRELVLLVMLLWLTVVAWPGLLPLEVYPQTLGLLTEGATLADSLGYTAYWEDGSPAFEFTKPASVEPLGESHFRLSYEATLESGETLQATCELTQQSHRINLDWTFDLPELTQQLNPWSCGFRFAFPNAPTDAEQRPWVKWVKPTGEGDIAGDTPYPDLATYLRKVRFGQVDLVFATPWYDPDWFYKRDLGRTHFIRWRPPEPGKPAKVSFSLMAADEATPDALLAAVATEQALWWRLDSPEGAKVFLPGQDVMLELAFGDASGAPQEARLALEARDYYGKQLASVEKVLSLTPWQSVEVPLSLGQVARGMVFVAGTLEAGGQTQQVRGTFAVLPEREPTVNAESPFGFANLIANPAVYPDQLPLEEIAAAAARVGAKWVRWQLWQPQAEYTEEYQQSVQQRLDVLTAAGLMVDSHIGFPLEPTEADWSQLEEGLRLFAGLSPTLRVGNEYNWGTQAKPEQYLALLTRIAELQHRVAPQVKVDTMGFGGVSDWFNEAVDLGLLDHCDALSIHPGFHPKAPEYWDGWGGWKLRTQLARTKQALTDKPDMELWIDEVYAPTTPDRSQLDLRTAADYLVRTYCLLLAEGARCIEWYQFQDGTWYAAAPNPKDIEFNFGVVYTDLSPKPPYVAFGTLTERLEGADYIGRLDLGDEELYGLRFERDGKPIDVLWSYKEKHECDVAWWPPEQYADVSRHPMEPWQQRWNVPVSVNLPATREVQVTDLMGNPRQGESTDGKVTLSLTGSPVFVTGLGEVPLRLQVWPDDAPL